LKVSGPVLVASKRKKPEVDNRTQLTSADLSLSDVDHGYAFGDFNKGDVVVVCFATKPMAGTIEQQNRRTEAFGVRLDTKLHDQLVYVSHRSLVPMEVFDDAHRQEEEIDS